jgi:hypothetical protein
VFGIGLGWLVQRSHGSRIWIIGPAIPFALAVLAYLVGGYSVEIQGSILAWFGLVALYAFGPVFLGRLLGFAWARIRTQPPSASPEAPTTAT